MVQTFQIRDSVEIPMRDGTTLIADIWLPDSSGSFPILLQRTAYRREDVHGSQYIPALEYQAALRRGFAIAVQDVRGRYASQGDFTPFETERNDGADTIAWLRKQQFSDGRIAMFGASYLGATQVLAAIGNPEGLVAISPQLTTARHGETWMYRGGAMELGFLLLWIIEALAANDLQRRIPEMSDLAAKRLTDFFGELQMDANAAFSRLPLIEPDLVAIAPCVEKWFNDARASASGEDRENLDELAKCDPSMLVTGGWNDIFVEGSIELFETARGRQTSAKGMRDRLIIGPWSHGNPNDWQGDVWHGYDALHSGLSQVQLDWFEDILYERNPISPVVRYFRSGSNTWHEAPDWPLPGVETKEVYLGKNTLNETPVQISWMRDWISDPNNPVPTTGGATFLPGLLLGRNSGPKEQSKVEARSDVISFTGPPLDAPLEVTGLVQAFLHVSSSAPTCDWTVRLCEVDENGQSFGLVDGIRRWKKLSNSTEATEVEVKLGHISHLFKEHSRLRVQIASSNFPRFNRNPQSQVTANCATIDNFSTATQKLFGGENMPTRLILPVISTQFSYAEI